MKQMKQNLSQKIPKDYCEKCEYKTDNKKDYTNFSFYLFMMRFIYMIYVRFFPPV